LNELAVILSLSPGRQLLEIRWNWPVLNCRRQFRPCSVIPNTYGLDGIGKN
jgi:hypothetical protein